MGGGARQRRPPPPPSPPLTLHLRPPQGYVALLEKIIDDALRQRGATSEDLFEVLQKSPHCFTCTVGCKVSRAQYHVEDSDEVLRVLEVLGAVSSEAASAPSAAGGGAAAVGKPELEA